MQDVKRSMFVGGHLPKESPYKDDTKTKWTPVQQAGKFSVTFDSDGKFQSLQVNTPSTNISCYKCYIK